MQEREKLYEFIEEKFGWTRVDIESRVKTHEDAFTIESWKPYCESLFPEVCQ
jgi:hypothetical protein